MTLEEYAKQQQNVDVDMPALVKNTSLEIRQQEAENARQQALEVYAHYQDNIRQTEQLSTEILKGLRPENLCRNCFLKRLGR